MSLTAELVARCERPMPDPGPPPGYTVLSETDKDELAVQLAERWGDQPIWVFAYGSLIWKPGFESVEQRVGALHGWHRSFCIEIRRWRGSPQQPGLMLALARGGRCQGVVYRLPDGDRVVQMGQLVRREIGSREGAGSLRFLNVETVSGPVRAMVFYAGPRGPNIKGRQPLDQVAHILARACGHGGSGAAYLFQTVAKLEEFGIRDRNLWRLQQLVAEEIAGLPCPPPAPVVPDSVAVG